jgi:ADP-heptose:LPS heptosyltransferase
MHIASRSRRLGCYLLNALFFLIVTPVDAFRRTRPRPAAAAAPSFLIVRLDHIGDVLLATPVFHSLKLRFPAARVSVLCGSWAAGILRGNPHVAEVLVLDCPWWAKQRSAAESGRGFWLRLARMIRRLRERKFDVFIDLRGDIRHFFLFGWLPAVPMRIANDRSGGSFLLTHVWRFQPGIHEIDKLYCLLRPFAPIVRFSRPEVFGDANSRRSLAGKLPDWESSPSAPYAVLFNGGRSLLRRIEVAKMIELCRALRDRFGLHCFLVGDGGDAAAGREIAAAIGPAAGFSDLCGCLSLLETWDLIRRAACFIGTDSSVLHLAAASDVPIVALYGPMQPQETRPLGGRVGIVFHEYPCSPCQQTVCVQNRTRTRGRCMMDVEVTEILAALAALNVDAPRRAPAVKP